MSSARARARAMIVKNAMCVENNVFGILLLHVVVKMENI